MKAKEKVQRSWWEREEKAAADTRGFPVSKVESFREGAAERPLPPAGAAKHPRAGSWRLEGEEQFAGLEARPRPRSMPWPQWLSIPQGSLGWRAAGQCQARAPRGDWRLWVSLAWLQPPRAQRHRRLASDSAPSGTRPAGTCQGPVSAASPTWQGRLLAPEPPSVFPAWPPARLSGASQSVPLRPGRRQPFNPMASRPHPARFPSPHCAHPRLRAPHLSVLLLTDPQGTPGVSLLCKPPRRPCTQAAPWLTCWACSLRGLLPGPGASLPALTWERLRWQGL